MPGSVGDDPVLDIAAKEALLGEGHRVLLRVDPPPVHTPEEEGSVVTLGDLLIEVVLEEFLRFS